MKEVEQAKQEIADALIAMVKHALSGGEAKVSEIRASSVDFNSTSTRTLAATLQLPDGQLSITYVYHSKAGA